MKSTRLQYNRSEKRLTHRESRRRSRRGLAPIEFIPFLPIFAIFLLVLLWVARVRIAQMAAGLEAAQLNQAAMATYEDNDTIPRQSPWEPLAAPEFRRVVHAFQPDLALTSGVVAATATTDTGPGVPLAINPIGPVSDESERLFHCWEDLVFDFPHDPHEQPQLTLPPAVRGFDPSLNDLSAFTRLREFSLLSQVSSLRAFRDLSQQALASQTRLRNAIESVEASMDALSQRIAELRSAEIPDFAEIQDLVAERLQLTQQLKQLRAGQKSLSEAVHHYEVLDIPHGNSDQ